MRKCLFVVSAALAFSAATCFADLPSYTMQDYGLGTYDRNNPSASTVVPKTPVLAFEGLTLKQMLDENFALYAHFCGQNVGNSFRKPVGGYRIQSFAGANGIDPFVIATFTLLEDPWTKGVTVKFTDGTGGVYAQAINAAHRKSLDLNYAFVKTLNQETGEITYQANDGSTNDSIATGYTSGGAYGICGLRTSKFLPPGDTAILIFANGAGEPVLTLDDIKDYDFGAYFAGGSASQAIRPAVVKGYNKALTVDGNGSVTALRVEFQLMDDHYVKCVVAQFTNGADGVYGQALAARFIDVNSTVGGGLGYAFVKADGTYNGNNSTVATQHASNNYGVYDFFAEPPPPSVTLELDQSKTWSELIDGVEIGDRSMNLNLLVTGENPTLTFDTAVDRSLITVTNESTAATATFALGSGSLALDQLEIPSGFKLTVPAGLGLKAVQIAANGVIGFAGSEDGSEVPASTAINGPGGVEIVSGTVTFRGQRKYTGGTTVRNGAVLKPGDRCYNIDNLSCGPFGVAKSAANMIVIEEGGTLDLNGIGDLYYHYTIVGKDGLTNSGAAIGDGKAQTYGLALSGDAELTLGNGFGLVTSGYGEAGAINLGDHTLVKSGANRFFIWTGGTTVSGAGTMEVAEGTLQVNKGGLSGSSAALKIDENGTVEALHNLAFKTIENNGVITFNPSLATNIISGTYSGTGVVRKTGKNLGLISFHNGAKSVYYVDQGTLGIYNRTSVQNSPYAFNTPENPNANMSVVVADGATFDLNGVADTSCSVTLAGTGVGGKGAFVNNKSHVSANNLQTVQLTLADDALVGGAYDFGLLAPGHRDTLLELGTYKLTINKTGNFWLHNATVTGTGTILVENGTLRVDKTKSLAEEATVEIGENGTLQLNINMNIGNLVDNGAITGSGTPIVNGTVTATSTAIPKLTLLDGATIKIPDADTPLKVSGVYNASGTIHIDAEDVELGDKAYVELTSFPAAANCTYKLDKAAPGLTLALVDGNLRLARGGLIIIIM